MSRLCMPRFRSIDIETQREVRRRLSRRGYHLKPAMEGLEDRCVPANVTWALPTGGDWNVASNWDTKSVPTSADNVFINLTSAATITHNATTIEQALSLSTSSFTTLSINGGGMKLLAAGSKIDGNIAVSSGTTLQLSGAIVTGGGKVDVLGTLLVDTNAVLAQTSASGVSINSGGKLTAGSFRVGPGAKLNVGSFVNTSIASNSLVQVDGTLSFGTGDNVTFTTASGQATQLYINSGGVLIATNTNFSSSNGKFFSEIRMTPGAKLTSLNSTYALTQMGFEAGSIEGATDLSGNNFDLPLYMSAGLVQYFSAAPNGTGSNNSRFQDINIYGGNITAGQTVSLNAIGTIAPQYLFPSGITVDPGATLKIGSNAKVVIPTSQTITVNGSMATASGSSITFGSTSNFTTEKIDVFGTFTAEGSTFSMAIANHLAQITTFAGGHFIAHNSTFNLVDTNSGTSGIFLKDGSVLASGDLAGNSFNTALSLPHVDIPLLTGNLRFQDVIVNGGTLSSGVLDLPFLPGSSPASRYVFNSGFTVGSGATLNVKANVPVVIGTGQTVTVNGSMTSATGSSFTFGTNSNFTTEKIDIFGTFTADGTTFSMAIANHLAQITAFAGGHLIAHNSTFNLVDTNTGTSGIFLKDNSVLVAGDLAGNTFNTALSLPYVDIPLLSGNLRFQDVIVNGGTLSTGSLDLPLLPGSSPTSRYVFNSGFTVGSGATLNVKANVPVVIGTGQTITVNGSMTSANGSSFTFGTVSNFTTEKIDVFGTFTADGTTFSMAILNHLAQVTAYAGGHLVAHNSTFNLVDNNTGTSGVILKDNSVLVAGDLSGNTFNAALSLPYVHLPFLSGNLRFQDVIINGGTLPSGSLDLPLLPGSSPTSRYVFGGGFTVGSGATLNVKANVPVVIGSGQTITVNGSMTSASGSSFAFGNGTNFSTEKIDVFGTFTADGTTFSMTILNHAAQVTAYAGGHLVARNSTFNLVDNNTGTSGVILKDNSLLIAGDLSGNTFNSSLSLPYVHLPLLAGNLRFQDVIVNGGTVATGLLDLPLLPGSNPSARYVIGGTLTIAAPATMNVQPNVLVAIASGQSIVVRGKLSIGSGSIVTFGTVSNFTTEKIDVFGTFTADGVTFVPAIANHVMQVVANSGGKIVAKNSNFGLVDNNTKTSGITIAGGSDVTLNADVVSGTIRVDGNAALNVHGNDFSALGANSVIGTGDSTKHIDFGRNYWGTADPTLIGAKIRDHGDDVNLPTIDFSPVFLNGPGSVTVDPITRTFSASTQLVSLHAVVTSFGGGTVTQGAVDFTVFDGSSVIGTASATVNNGSATVDYTIPAGLPKGVYVIQGVYSDLGGLFFGASDSSHFLTINKASTITNVTANSVVTFNNAVSQTVNLKANVILASGTGAVNEGSVVFTVLNGATPIGSPVSGNVTIVNGSGVATADFVLPIAAAQGIYKIQATYSGSNNFGGSTENVKNFTVNRADTATLVTPASAIFNATAGQKVTLSAGISTTSGTVNEGLATFKILNASNVLIGTAVATSVTDGSPSVKYDLPINMAIGTYKIQVDYTDVGGNFNTSTDSSQTLTISKASSVSTPQSATATFTSLVDQSVALTAAITSDSGLVDSGTVKFTVLSGSTVIGAPISGVAVSNGKATTTSYNLPAGTPAGTYTIKVEYAGGSGSFLDSIGVGAALTVSAANTTIIATAASSPAYSLTLNQDVIVSAGVSSTRGAITSGTVTFRVLNGNSPVGNSVIGTVDANGSISKAYTIPAGTAAGTYTLEAVFAGTTNFLASTDIAHTLIVVKADSTTAPIANSVTFNATQGQNTTLSASVSSGAKPVNEGTERITILKGSTVIGLPITANVTAGASIPTSYALPAGLPGGTYTILTEYLGSPNYLASSAQADVFTVNAANTTTTTSSLSITFDGMSDQVVNIPATIVSAAGTPSEGTATFTVMTSGNVLVGTAKTVSVVNGAATAAYIIPAGTPGGTYSILATYNGTGNYKTSGDVTKTLTIVAANAVLATSPPSEPPAFNATVGQAIPVSTTITSDAGPVTSGDVTFRVLRNSTVIGDPITIQVDNQGVAAGMYTLPANTGIGTYTLEARYGGTPNFKPFTDTSKTIHVKSATATLAAGGTAPYDATKSQTLVFNATVEADSGDVVDIGHIVFTVLDASNNQIGDEVSGDVHLGSASATYTLPANVKVGSYRLVAHYFDPPDFFDSEDSGLLGDIVVTAAATTASLPTGTTTATYNAASQSLPVSVSVTSPGGTVGQGKVNFQILQGVTVIASLSNVTVASGGASGNILLPADLAAGTYAIRAVFFGANDFQGSTAVDQTLKIDPATTTTTTPDLTSTYNLASQVVFVTATVSSLAGTVGKGTVTFSVLDGATTIATSNAATVTGGVASGQVTLPAGTSAKTYTVKASYSGASNFLLGLGTSTIKIDAATPTVTWANPSDIVYGTTLSATQLNAKASVPGTFTYSPPLNGLLGAGNTQVLSVSFTPDDAVNYVVANRTVTINVNQAAPIFTGVTASQTITYSDDHIDIAGKLAATTAIPSGQTVSINIGAGLATGSAAIQSDGKYQARIFTDTLNANLSGLQVRYDYEGDSNFAKAFDISTILTILLAPQVIIIKSPPAIPTTVKYPQPVFLPTEPTATPPIVISPTSNVSTRASANGDGFIVTFDGGSGPTQGPGIGKAIVTLSRAGDANHLPAPDLVLTFDVTPGTDASINLGGLSATYDGLPHVPTFTTTPSGLPVTFSYSKGGVPVASPIDGGIYDVIASISDPRYTKTTTSTLVINRATPPIDWKTPAPIVYGTPLSSAQFTASSVVDHQAPITYNHAIGEILGAGKQTLTATLTPTRSENYTINTASVSLDVTKAQPSFTGLSASRSITFGSTSIDVQGNIRLTPSLVPVGEKVTIRVGSSTKDATIGADGSFSATLDTSTIAASATPYAITYHYDGDANFLLADDGSTTLTVGKKTPDVSWNAGADILYGTPLSLGLGKPLSATASVPGQFDYSPNPEGMILDAGTRILTASFNPTDGVNFANVNNATATLRVVQASPIFSALTLSPQVTFGTGSIVLGGKLAATNGAIPTGEAVNISFAGLTGSPRVSADGSFSFQFNTSPTLHTGSYLISYDFAGNTNFKASADAKTSLLVKPADQTISIPNTPPDAIFGTSFVVKPTSTSGLPVDLVALNATVVTAVGGGFTVTPTTGTGDIKLTAKQAGDADRNPATDLTVTIAAKKATASITLSNLNFTYDGNAHGATPTPSVVVQSISQIYSPGGDKLPINAGTYDVTFTIVDPNYAGTASGKVVISPKAVTIDLVVPPATTYDGKSHPATASVAGLSLIPTIVYTPGASTPPTNAGTYTVTAAIGDPNYTAAPKSGTITIAQAPSALTWPALAAIEFGTPLGSAQRTASGPGAITYDFASPILAPGDYPLHATLIPTDRNFSATTAERVVHVNKTTPTFQGLTDPPTIAQGSGPITLSGILKAANGVVPEGQNVTILVNGTTANATVNAQGAFTATIDASGQSGDFPITYQFAGSANFNAAPNGAKTLSVTPPPLVLAHTPVATPAKGPVTRITITFTGKLDASGKLATSYKLTIGKKAVAIRTPVYSESGSTSTVTITPTKGFALTKPVLLTITAKDSLGRALTGKTSFTFSKKPTVPVQSIGGPSNFTPLQANAVDQVLGAIATPRRRKIVR